MGNSQPYAVEFTYPDFTTYAQTGNPPKNVDDWVKLDNANVPSPYNQNIIISNVDKNGYSIREVRTYISIPANNTIYKIYIWTKGNKSPRLMKFTPGNQEWDINQLKQIADAFLQGINLDV